MEVNRRTQADRTAATKAALTAAARRLFAEHGYGNVGTQAIVEAAGVSRGALYHQFGDKLGLFTAVYEDTEAEAVGRAMAIVAEAGDDDPLAALLRGFDEVVAALTDPGMSRILLIDAPAVLGWEEWRARGEAYGLAVIEGLMNHAIAIGRIPDQPVRPTAHVLLGAIDESALYVSRAADPDRARAEVRAVAERLIAALALPLEG
ncbi:TetR/AcrR family transcriptional regulator [Tsukamurella soli]|uniref:TetR/AcrR family transcriptional regulator n=1 Tax=Tsukamurella soli TaxID=644556 RepID=A0ABP8K5M0_9ACTN